MSEVKKIGILRFLGTNCDRDMWGAIEALGMTPEWLWYEDQFESKKYDALVVPGGFSHGDYLRSGALAAKTPAMKSVLEGVKFGTPVIGVCNGFQILCETNVLPGALMKNKNGKFIDDWVELEVVKTSPYTKNQTRVRYPIAHGDGRYFINDDGLKELQDSDQVWLRYFENPNGSVFDIAGVKAKQHEVYGLMPHPERALYEWMGGVDGQNFFEGFLR